MASPVFLSRQRPNHNTLWPCVMRHSGAVGTSLLILKHFVGKVENESAIATVIFHTKNLTHCRLSCPQPPTSSLFIHHDFKPIKNIISYNSLLTTY